MSTQAPPTLLELAGQSLLRDQSRAISALEDLPMELFPPLFMEAFTRGHTGVLRKMVQAWPFPCLPLGTLMKNPDLEMLQVTLDGLDMLLAQKVRPRRWKLQVLDLGKVHQNFWRTWSGTLADDCSLEAITKQPLETCPKMATKKPLMVFINLYSIEIPMDEFQTHVFLWVKQRTDVLHLCCRELQIFQKPIHDTIKVLEMLDLDCIQKLEWYCSWDLSTLASFAPYLGQMSNLRELCLPYVPVSAHTSPEEEEQLITQVTSQLHRMGCLHKFFADSVSFLEGHLDQVLRHLKIPLETLGITHCQLSDSDWNHLSHCPNTTQLRHLDLSGIKLTNFSSEPLNMLLDKVAATLETLELEDCAISDNQLLAILPTLSRCSQLSTFFFSGNNISMSVLKDLLPHTAKISRLSREIYPAPLESYDAQGALNQGRFSQLCAELTAIVRDIRQPEVLLFMTVDCPECYFPVIYDLGLTPCCCMIQA